MTQESEKSGSGRPQSRAATFEKSFQKLEESVRRLEAGQLTLEDATRLFEEGMKLAKECSELLSAAELKITRLQSGFAEQMNLVPGDEDAAADDAEDDE